MLQVSNRPRSIGDVDSGSSHTPATPVSRIFTYIPGSVTISFHVGDVDSIRRGDHVRGRDGAVVIVPLTPAAFCLAGGSPATAGSKRQCQAPASKHGADCPPTHYRCASARHQHLPSLPRPRPTGAGHKNASVSLLPLPRGAAAPNQRH